MDYERKRMKSQFWVGLVLAALSCTINAQNTLPDLPVPANQWEAQHVYIIDKDVNSVFINANELYIKSLQVGFPEIVSTADLAGKNDYYFYPPELAAKYQADDARVIASGERFETIEEYVEDGVRGFVYTEKIPIKNPAGQVFALRIRFYLIPEPGQTVIQPPSNLWEQNHLYVIDKNTNSVFLNANNLYIKSLLPKFPEIRSVTNFIGRDDFAFYPEDLAQKYRADDARVMASGESFETIEEYVEDGVRGFVFTQKIPLKDESGQVFGIRVWFYLVPQPGQTVIPPASNPWELQNVFIIDKNTQSQFINANDLYIKSLQPLFPEIRSVTNLIGRDDFAFYPDDLAKKYQADDALVINSGQVFETIEENQPEGGVRTYVYDRKTPLRNAEGEIIGVRVYFYLIPQPGQTTIPAPANQWEAENVFIIDKNTQSQFINANDLYIKSLQPLFPEIRSVTNLIGRDDFAFYPEDLARKYQADDARVMASGESFETIEEYFENGVRGFAFTQKMPLKDESGQVFGIRVRFYLIPEPGQTVIPPAANRWEAENVFVIDKNTRSEFINANDLYIRSLQGQFPDIRSVTNLIGKNDLAFYPTDLAEMYRADDARVIASGLPFETVEEYGPAGEERSFVFTRKIPLQDDQGQVFALRILVYEIPRPGQTTIPAPANRWEAENVFVIDKNTRSEFINANDLYIRSLQTEFPDIRSVTNLIGRNDFAFYPEELAQKFREDDARVIASGIEFSTVEDNQLEGGQRHAVFVRKIPLRDEGGTIIGLRITFFDLPVLSILVQNGNQAEISWSDAAYVFSLEWSAAVGGPWEEVPQAGNATGGQLRVTVPMAESSGFFRLRLR
jgi:hypothetical protein